MPSLTESVTRQGSPASFIVLVSLAIALYQSFQWLLPKPIPGIPYNKKAAMSLLGDVPDMLSEIKVTNQFMRWAAKQTQNLNSPVVQVFIKPFSKPWVFLADFGEAKDILQRRKDFDKSKYIGDGLSPMGFFSAGQPTGHLVKQTKQWQQDITNPSFISTNVGPLTHSAMSNMLSLLETKAYLANGRPFDARQDISRAAEDAFASIFFGEDCEMQAINPQRQHLAQLNPSVFDNGNSDDPVIFPEAPDHDFFITIRRIVDMVTGALMFPYPRLYFKFKSLTAGWAKRALLVKDQLVLEQIEKSLKKPGGGLQKKTGVDMMLAREQAAAEKQGRAPQYRSQIMIDEVRLPPARVLP